MWDKREVFLVFVACPLLLGSVVSGQRLAILKDDLEPFDGQQQIPAPDQFSSFRRGRNLHPFQSELMGLPRSSKFPEGITVLPMDKSNGPQIFWWNRPNAFQRPAGHPGVQPLASSENIVLQPSSSPALPPVQRQSQKAPKQETAQFNTPAPSEASPTQQSNPADGPQLQQHAHNNLVPQRHYNLLPEQSPTYNRQLPQLPPPTLSLQTQTVEVPGCELVNNTACRHHQNFNSGPALPLQTYEPPPLNPPSYLEQSAYKPLQQQSVPAPILSYKPPPQIPSNYLSTNLSHNSAPVHPPLPPNSHEPTEPHNIQKSLQVKQSRPFQTPQASRARPITQHIQKQSFPSGVPDKAPAPYPGCPAAMLCVPDEYCNTIGLIEETPAQLSAIDRLQRVALMQCSEPISGLIGVCCREPNYADPYPDTNERNMEKTNGVGHHPHQSQSPAQGEKRPIFKLQHLVQGNNLAGSRDTSNSSAENTKVNGSNVVPNNHLDPLPSSQYSESKQTPQVLEPCSLNELCISMSQCHSLNPDFMATTGLHHQGRNNNASTGSPQNNIKRCKYERSGIHYLCCRKPAIFPNIITARPFVSTLPQREPNENNYQLTTTSPSQTLKPTSSLIQLLTSPIHTPTPAYHPIHLTTTPQIKSSLITGVGLRFHSGLHSYEQLELNNRKPNPYAENEKPIILLTSPMTIKPVPKPTTQKVGEGTSGSSSSSFLPTASGFPFMKTTATVTSTTPLPPTPLGEKNEGTTPPSQMASTIGGDAGSFVGNASSSYNASSNTMTTATDEPPTTTTEGKVDITKIPKTIPLLTELKEKPPIGFIFKGENLFIPEIEVPSQNFLLPSNDFKERMFPVEEEENEEIEPTTDIMTTQEDATTTVYSLLDEQLSNSTEEVER